ncbi:MAG: efflux RND transporter periplasmic adaptor subunit [Lachnospiraceae bacterium]|nr:efflux RND transporter periplasmic adaptor subunit [Lachnospiraceae bacterium]
MKNRQRKLALLLCAVMSISVLGGCGQKEEAVEEIVEDVAIVEASAPIVGDLKLSGEFIATVNPDESVYIIPKATAEVMEVMVKAGDVVEAGDVLAVLDDTMAQLSMRSAQIGLDNAQRAYTLSYGDGATLLNDMQTDSNIQKVEDGMEAQQEGYLDAMDSLARYQDLLEEAEDELANVRKEYDYREDPEEIMDYADSIDKNTLEGAAEYQAALARYQAAATLDAQWSAKVDGYKQAIDGCEQALEELQDGMNSTYETYSQTATSTAITNGELREEQKQVSQNSISAAQLAVEQAQEGLDTYVITAAISGVVENVNIKVHDFATSSNPAFVISNKDTMVATYYVSEDVRNTFSVGQEIEVEKDGERYLGEVIEIGGTIDTTTGLFKIKAGIKGDVSGMLSGTKVKVTTDTYRAENALIIPYDAVYYDGTQAYVYTVVDERAKKTNVTTGLYDVENIVITEGLTKDDVVITTWSAQLREGVAVSVKEPEQIQE